MTNCSCAQILLYMHIRKGSSVLSDIHATWGRASPKFESLNHVAKKRKLVPRLVLGCPKRTLLLSQAFVKNCPFSSKPSWMRIGWFLQRVWLAGQGVLLCIKASKKNPSAKDTIWSLFFIILYQRFCRVLSTRRLSHTKLQNE